MIYIIFIIAALSTFRYCNFLEKQLNISLVTLFLVRFEIDLSFDKAH